MNHKMNNKGMTLVEVVCGFLLLVVAITSFIKIIDLSAKLSSTAVTTKEKNLNFEELYYSGQNYKLKNKKVAFREYMEVIDTSTNAPLAINLTEWHPDGKGYFLEWNKNDKGLMELHEKDSVGNPLTSVSLLLKNTRLKRIENIYDTDATRVCVFRYVYEEALPAVTP